MVKDKVAEALGILRRAMQFEEEGHTFYLKAAETTPDKKGKETFTTLADDEKKHLNLIQWQYESLAKEQKWLGFSEVKPVRVAIDSSLFPSGKETLQKAISGKSSELDSLLFGLDIENKSYDLYRRAASAITNPLGRQMFEFLAGEERGHFNILMMRYEFIAGPIGWRY